MTKIATIALSFGLLAAGAAPVLAGPAAPAGSTTPSIKTTTAMQSERDSDSYTQALNYLESNGYTGISNISRDGLAFDATAWHDGRQVTVMVDPSTHSIQPKG
jgi:hypothetical protein